MDPKKHAMYYRPGDRVEVDPSIRKDRYYETPPKKFQATVVRTPPGKNPYIWVFVLADKDSDRPNLVGGWYPEQITLLHRGTEGPTPVLGDHIILGEE